MKSCQVIRDWEVSHLESWHIKWIWIKKTGLTEKTTQVGCCFFFCCFFYIYHTLKITEFVAPFCIFPNHSPWLWGEVEVLFFLANLMRKMPSCILNKWGFYPQYVRESNMKNTKVIFEVSGCAAESLGSNEDHWARRTRSDRACFQALHNYKYVST